jgi:hypothetical protein
VGAGVHGLSVRAFRKLVRIVATRGGEQSGTGRRWGLSLADRVLLVAVYYRTNLTFRQVALLFGISKSAANRVVDHLAPLLALAPVTRKHSPDTVLIVDGTLVPTTTGASPPPARTIAIRWTCRSSSTPTPAWSSRSANPHRVTATTAAPTPTLVLTSNAGVRR